MYTRNYRQTDVRSEVNPTPVQTLNAEADVPEVPLGYSGTALLREREAEVLPEEPTCIECEAEREPLRVRRFKMVREPVFRKECDEPCEIEEITAPADECFSNECPDITKKPSVGRVCLKDRTFSIEDMLLSALIVLLINEGADDMTIILLGFLLISEL